MMSTRMHMLKFVTYIGLPAVILWMFSYVLSRIEMRPPATHAVVPSDTGVRSETIVQRSGTVRTSLRDSIVEFGMGLLGTRYVAGSCSKDGFDCSGFVYYVFRHFNIEVPRSSIQYRDFGREIPVDSVKKGDILVFLSPTRNVIGHVGIVTDPRGKASDFIHSSSGSEMKVIITSLEEEHYTRRFVKAVDVLHE